MFLFFFFFTVSGNVEYFVPFVALPIYLVNTGTLCLHSIHSNVLLCLFFPCDRSFPTYDMGKSGLTYLSNRS
jgi:hypothetical protein